jgi:hypothetical protein
MLISIALVIVVALLIDQYASTKQARRDRDRTQLKYQQLKQMQEFCMEAVLHEGNDLAYLVRWIRGERSEGKRPKWNMNQLQDLEATAENLLRLVEDNTNHG